MKEMRRVLALLMCFVMLVGYLPAGAMAAETEPTVAVVEQTQPAEEVVEAVVGEAVSVSKEKADSTPAETEETEAVEEIIEAVLGEEITASKPAAVPAETEPAETLEEVEASEEAEDALADVAEDDLDAALAEALDYIETIMDANDPSEVVGTYGAHFTWDNESREFSKNYLYDWSYYNGVVFEGLEYLYEVTGDTQYRDYVLEYMSSLIAEDGSWAVTANNKDKTAAGYVADHGADCYKTASLLLDAYTMSGDARYLDAAAMLYADLDAAAEKYSLPYAGGNYRHTWASDSDPDLWLDGLYMILPFRAEYAARIGDQAELDLIVERLQWVSDNMYNEANGLFYHAADNATDNSDSHWLRAMGWYAAAMVDVMDSMEGKNLKTMQAQLKKLVDGMADEQNAVNGMWLNNLKQTESRTNPYETSGTALVAYAIMKAVNNGWLEESYAQMATNAFVGICQEKLAGGVLTDICFKGNPETASSEFVDQEGKGVGPFIMLYAELVEYLDGAVELESVLESIVAAGRETFDQREAFEMPVVTALFTDYSAEEVTDYEITGDYDMDVPGTYTLTVTYGGKTAKYSFTVVEKAPVLVEGVIAEVEDVTEDVVVMDALLEKGIVDNYVAYDITAELAEGETAEVSVPVPAEWAGKDLVAYYVDDEGNVSDEPFTVTYADGYASFTVSHFSTYVVGLAGEETKVELNGNELNVENYTVVRYEPTEVYVQVDSISGPGDYLVTNTATANATANILAASGNNVTNTTGTVKSGVVNNGSGTITYIEKPDKAAVWTVTATANGYHLYNTNQSRFLLLNRTGRWPSYTYTLTASETADRWTSPQNKLRNAEYTSYYLRYNNGWSVSNSSSNTVYFFQKQTVNLRTEYDRSGLYSIEGNPITMVVKEDGTTTAQLTGKMTFSPNDSKLTPDVTNLTTEPTYRVWDDPATAGVDGDTAGIISGFNGNTLTFSGKYGSAVVEMTYSYTLNGVTYDMVTYIQVTAQAPYYTIEILDAAGAPIDDIRYHLPADIMDSQSHPVSYKVTHTYYNAAGVLVTEEITPAAGSIKWEIENEDIAELAYDEISGGNAVWFNAEGKTTLTVYYEYEEGKSVIDVIDLVATDRDYVIPEDETADFPEYPNEGAVRIDKTAKAVGNFSQTGVAQVELSMAGVPFSAGNEIDVVIMVDMSGSMANNGRVPAAKAATIAAIEALVKNEDGSFNDNRVAVYTFSTNLNPNDNAYFDLDTFDQTRLDAMVNAEINAWDDNGGTDYGDALSKCQSVLEAAKTDGIGNNRQQFVIFVTDGAPTYNFYYYTNTSTGAYSHYEGDGDEYSSVIKNLAQYTEKYSYDMRKDDVTVYSVGIEIEADSDKGTILKKIGGMKDENGNVVDATSETYANYALFPEEASELTDVFLQIVGQIKQAATEIVVDDLVAPEFSLILNVPSGVTLPDGTALTMEVVEYELDADKNRKEPAKVLESISAADTSKVTLDAAGNVVAVDANLFDYDAEEQRLIWKTDKLENKELAIRYYVYLNNSAGVDPEDAVEAGTYKTNTEATMTYKNYLGNTCQQTFPVPQLTWNGAQVTYQFYLVNEDGQPVNRAGRVIPFAEAIYVTDPVTKSVTWNQMEGVSSLSADYLASELLPGVYTLYDSDAYYEIRVYQTEGVDGPIGGKNWNYFEIDGSSSVGNKNTTKVFNSKSGAVYTEYGIYSQQNVGTVLATTTTDSNGNTVDTTVTTTKKATDIDYSSTVVNFAVMWTPALQPDTVVIDYGLDVEVNVATNDVMDSTLVGVMTEQPKSGSDTVLIGSGTYKNSVGKEEAVVLIDGLEVGTAKKVSQETVSFSLNRGNGMQLNKPAVFYYETETVYWTYDQNDPDDKGTKNTDYMYSSVSVIPATTVYYEDEYVQLKTFVNGQERNGWDVNSVKASGNQATDRPGVYNNMEDELDFDANNVYGFDGAYNTCSTYSMNNSAKVHVNESTYATAEFDFYGTGFDVISMTSNQTGTLVVQAYPYNADGSVAEKPAKSVAVDTYYGYDYGMHYVEYVWAYDYNTDASGNTVRTEDWRMIAAHWENPYETEALTALPESAAIGETVVVHQMYWMQSESDRFQVYTYTKGAWVAGETTLEEPETTYGVQTSLSKIEDFDGNAVSAFAEGDTICMSVSPSLYQVPVMKIDGLTYGKYRAKIIATYSEWLDHTMYDGYDLYLDAIRIYDPAGDTYGDNGNIDQDIQDAYIADGEAWPKYFELRNLLLSAQDFDALTAGKQTSGAIFVDQQAGTYTVADYESYGPNNELYLAPGQAVSFTLNHAEAADVQIGLKSANGKAVAVKMITNADATGTTANIATSTDRYYSIAKHLDASGVTTITFQNVGEAGSVASITNVKITYTEEPAEIGTISEGPTVTKDQTNAVLKALNGNVQAEPEVKLDADLDVSIRKTSVTVGNSVVVKITTSADVDSLTVNGEKITKFSQNRQTGKRSWTATVKAEEAGDLEIEVVAYNGSTALDTDTLTVEVTKAKATIAQNVINTIISKLFR